MNQDSHADFPTLAARWRELWDAMMTQYCPSRESCFTLALDIMEFTLRGVPVRILDVGCGSGAFEERVLERFSHVAVTALDHDTSTLRIARTVMGAERVRWIQSEVAESWEELGLGEFDMVFMGWLTHELAPWQLAALYANVFAVLRPTGLLLNADFMPNLAPGFRELAQDMTLHRLTDDLNDYHRAVSQSPAWNEALDPEAAPLNPNPPQLPAASTRWRTYHTAVEHRRALDAAGFRETEEVWRYMESGMILAVR